MSEQILYLLGFVFCIGALAIGIIKKITSPNVDLEHEFWRTVARIRRAWRGLIRHG